MHVVNGWDRNCDLAEAVLESKYSPPRCVSPTVALASNIKEWDIECATDIEDEDMSPNPIAVAIGSLMILSTLRPAMAPTSVLAISSSTSWGRTNSNWLNKLFSNEKQDEKQQEQPFWLPKQPENTSFRQSHLSEINQKHN